MKTLLPNKDYFIIDNEFYQVEKRLPTKYWIYKCNIKDEVEGSYEKNVLGDDWFERLHDKANYYDVVATTNPSLLGVKQLDRSLFVKGVDVFEKAEDYARARYNRQELTNACISGYIAAHNANKNEFTRDEVELLLNKAINSEKHGRFFYIKQEISNLRPLSLPSSITINGDEITIKW